MVAESRQTAVIETDRLKEEHSKLQPYEWFQGCFLSYKGFLSLIDGAMLTYITRNVTHWRCNFCFLLPREYALLPPGQYQIREDALDTMALSILHFMLRVGDHLLKIGYSQDFKKARVAGQDCKTKYNRRKKWIQYRFRKDKQLLVDVPLRKGGNSTCGNTWRQVNIF